MNDGNDRQREAEAASAAQDLRRRAEPKAREMAAGDIAPTSVEEAVRLLHELRVHQIELELQNDELRRAQLALDASRTRYFELYDLAPVGYVTLSEHGLIREANLRACTMLGIPRGGLVRQPITHFITSHDQDIYYLHRKRLIETGVPQSCELRMQQPEGEQLWARLEATLARDAEDGSPLLRITLSDITEQRLLQTQLALADRLSNLGLLAASIGHEVNNPLTYLLYNLETLTEDLPALARGLADVGSPTRVDLDDMIDRARSAVEGAHRIRDLVKGMQVFSHTDDALIEPLSFNRILKEALTLTAREISARARIVRDLGQVPPVAANHGQLGQVFLNLLINAAHSIEEGHAEDNEISIRTWHDDGDVVAEIRDTGRGIAAENLDRIFDPFFTTKLVGSGTGLGLSICMKIVTALGGTLTVRSKVGDGSTFTVRLPAQADIEDNGQSPTVPGGTAVESANLRGRILVIDDEPNVRKILRRLLRTHQVVDAASGEEGRAILAEDSEFDLVLCDLQMPGLTGMDLFTWLKEANPAAAKRVVFITGGAFTPKLQEFLASTARPVLKKPFDIKHFESQVAALIQSARGPR